MRISNIQTQQNQVLIEQQLIQYKEQLQENYQNDDSSSEVSSFYEKAYIRISTAPARPLTEIELFKRSQEFLFMEQAVLCSQNLIQKNYQKYDLDSQDGQKVCKRFLQIIEKLCELLQVKTLCREYRKTFSKAYRILFKEGELSYITEILESAQERFPYLWVNGDKYIFSNEVLNAGQQLLDCFFQLQYILRSAYSKVCQESSTYSTQQIRNEMINSMEKFDEIWVKFEKHYVLELMQIENDARRQIQKAIEIEKELEQIEIHEKIKGKKFIFNQDIQSLKEKLCGTINQINSVANIEGKGRDDLQFEVLQESEYILRKITKEQSQAVRQLAENIKNSFQRLRDLFVKYDQNMEMVDPQLKNNADLVEALFEYEKNWEKETTAQKHRYFSEQLDCRDSNIFLNIPCLMILKCLNNEDKNICAFFLPQIIQNDGNKLFIMLEELKKEFNEWKAGHTKLYEFHNILEKILLGIQLSVQDQFAIEFCKQQIENMVHKIKQLAIELQRKNPTEWNNFLDAALCEIVY